MTAETWNKRYEEYEKLNIKREKQKSENSEIHKLPAEIKNALDIGCGTGEDVRIWARKKVYVTGWDISKVAIRIAKKETDEETRKYIKYEVGDWKELAQKTKEKSYDLVYSVMGPDMENEDAIHKLNRISKKYVRLIQFIDGKTDIFEEIDEKLNLTTQKNENENRIIEILKKENISYELKKITIEEKIEEPIKTWIQYFKNIEKYSIYLDKIKEILKEKSTNGKIKSKLKADYLQITWTV